MTSHARLKDVPVIGRTFGNVHVIKMMKRVLQRAKQGKLSYAAIVMVEHPHILVDYAGSVHHELLVPEILNILKDEVEKGVTKRDPPVSNAALDASHACYNIAREPVSYDFMPWVIRAEMTRVKEGAPAPLKVAFWRGYSDSLGLETAYREQMFKGVVRPMLALIGAVEDEMAVAGRMYETNYADLVDRARAGETVPRLAPSDRAMDRVANFFGDEPFVTITLREADHWPHRNSNLSAWLAFAGELRRTGLRAIFVRDTQKAFMSLLNHQTYPAASTDLDVRMALYESAECNFSVSNGPGTMTFFGTRPCRQFVPISQSSEYAPETAEWWQQYVHMKPGEQFPWAGPDQKLVWAADTYENIRASWS